MQRKSIAATTLTLALSGVLSAQAQERGAWMWQSPKSAYGSLQVVGNAQAEADTLARLKLWKVKTLYISASGDGATNTAALRAWNARLAKEGFTPYLLLSTTEFLLPEGHAQALKAVDEGFTRFNAAAKPEERFAGVAFDLEPHILASTSQRPGWKDTTPMRRREYLVNLLELYKQVRAAIGPKALLEASLPVWMAHLGGSVGWQNSADHDAWFHAMAADVQPLEPDGL